MRVHLRRPCLSSAAGPLASVASRPASRGPENGGIVVGKRGKDNDDNSDDLLPGQPYEPPKEPPSGDGTSPQGEGEHRK